MLHVPLMSFLGQARPWGEPISKQATERSSYSPLLLLLLLVLQLITPSVSASLCCFLFLSVSVCKLSLPSTLQFSLSVSISLPLVGSTMSSDFSQRHKQLGQQVKLRADRETGDRSSIVSTIMYCKCNMLLFNDLL